MYCDWFLRFIYVLQSFIFILQNLLRFDESVEEEASGVHNAMGILESLLELRAKKVASIVVQTEGAVAWLLNRVRAKPTAALPTANKLYGACVCVFREMFSNYYD